MTQQQVKWYKIQVHWLLSCNTWLELKDIRSKVNASLQDILYHYYACISIMHAYVIKPTHLNHSSQQVMNFVGRHAEYLRTWISSVDVVLVVPQPMSMHKSVLVELQNGDLQGRRVFSNWN